MAITGQWKRRKITINADAYISGAVSNVPVLVKFNSTSHPDLFASGDDGDSVWFSSDAGGQTTLYHENVVFDTTDAIFWIKVDLSSTADTVIYFWYGQPAITGTESASNVWTNARGIYHLEGLTDSSGNSNTLTARGASSTTSGLVGGAYSFDGFNDYLYASDSATLDISGTDFTVIAWCYLDTTGTDEAILSKTVSFDNDAVNYALAQSTSSGYRFITSDSTGTAGHATLTDDTTGYTTSAWAHLVGTYRTSDKRQEIYINSTMRESATAGYAVGTNSGLLYIGSYYTNTFFDGIIDEVWIFSDLKSSDFITAVYNNVQNYSTFVTIDGAVTIGSSPKMICPVWATSGNSYNRSVSAGLGIAGAVTHAGAFNRSVAASLGIAGAVTTSATYSRSVASALGISASVEYSGYEKEAAVGIGIAGVVSTSADFNRSVSARIGITGAISTTATFSRSVAAGVGIAASVSLGTSKSVSSALGIAATVSRAGTYSRSVSAAIGFTVDVTPDYYETPMSAIGLAASVSVTGDFGVPKYWEITILHGVTTTNLNDANIIESARLKDQLGKRADEFELRLYNNDGDYSSSFAIGDDVYFYLGYYPDPTTKIFHGIITSIEFDLPYPNKNTMIIRGVDFGTFRLGQTIVSGIKEFTGQTPTAIIQSLMAEYCPDITYANVETFEDTIPNIKFGWEYVGDCIETLATLAGADFYVDEYDDLHFYDNTSLSSDHTIGDDEIFSARIQRDSYKHYDRVFVIGGKEKHLDVENATADTAVNTYAKYYGSQFTVSETNLLYVSAYIKKVGTVSEDLPFEIYEDNSGDPTGDIVAWGSFGASNITTDAAWVQSTLIDLQLSTSKTYWLVFKLTGTNAANTYQIYHDNSTANGHEDSEDGSTGWTDRTGLLAFKTYYGVQIVKESKAASKIAGDHYTDIVITDPTIDDYETATLLAQQKVTEYALKYSSDLTLKSKFTRFRSGDVVSLSITGVPTLADQTILSAEMNFTEPTVSTVEIRTTPTNDFYTAFAGLFADLRKLKIEALYEQSNLLNDYVSAGENVTPADSATLTEAATTYEAQFDDTEAVWDVSVWE